MKKVLAILLVAAVIAAAIWLILHFGLFGLGKGSGSSSGNSAANSSSAVSEESADESSAEISEEDSEAPAESSDAPAEESSEAPTVTEEKTYADVTVSENSYLYQNSTMELDALLAELEKLGADVTVRITDEKASLKAYEDLTAALKEKSIPFEDAAE